MAAPFLPSAGALESRVPVIDIAPLLRPDADRAGVAQQLDTACRAHGFIYVVGHGVDDPRVQAQTPLHGRNLFPQNASLPGFRETLLDYMAALTALGHRLMQAIALSLELPAGYFAERYTADPLILFRLFNYPTRALPPGSLAQWGVGEHTDYGLLTMLRQDSVGGLQVKTRSGWIAAPPLPRSFVCNIGDMLDRMTGGRYRSTPHRVRLNSSGTDRLSFPFFFDPNFDARVRPIEGLAGADDNSAARWDHANVHGFDGTYGDYLIGKVGKVFPDLKQQVLGAGPSA